MAPKTTFFALVLALLFSSSGFASEPSGRSLYLTYHSHLLALLETRLDRQRDGYVFSYYPDGTIKTQVRYDQGHPVGDIKEFDPQGRLASQWPVRDGQLNGTAMHFHPNGQLRLEISYAENIPHGRVAYYGADGQMIQSGEYHWGLLTKLSSTR